MPRRPREHGLETESRRAFASVLPSEWVLRDKQDDYGIDQEVEIFESGVATGLIFLVQLKATDQGVARALRVSFRPQQVSYFASLACPTLIVSFHAPSRRLFGKWFHRHEPRAGGATRSLITLDEADEITSESVEALAGEVRAIRLLTSVSPQWPLQFEVSGSGKMPVSDARLVAECNLISGGEHARFVAGDTGIPPVVNVTTKQVTSHLSVASTTLHGDFSATDATGMARSVVAASAIALSRVGHLTAASRLLLRCGPKPILDAPELSPLVFGIFIGAQRMADGFQFAEKMREEKDGELLAVVLESTIVLTRDPDLSEADREVMDGVLARRVIRSIDSGDGDRAAAAYSYANWKFANGEYEASRTLLLSTADSDPSYLSRVYFLHELGASCFETERYSEAVDWYRKALDSDENPLTLACHADALLRDGRIQMASDGFDKYLNAAEEASGVWILTKAFASYLISDWSLSEQARDASGAVRLYTKAMDETDFDRRMTTLADAIRLDVFCGAAWHEMARSVMNEQNDANSALMPIVAAALLHPVPEVWADCARVALDAGDLVTVEAIVDAAVATCGRTFSVALIRTFPDDAPDEVIAGIESMVEDAARRVRTRPAVVRIPGPDGTMVELEVRKGP